MSHTHQSPPPGYARVTPSIAVDGGVAAVEFYTKAFGAEPGAMYLGPDGTLMHGEISFGGMTLYVCDAMPAYDLVAPGKAGGVTSSFTCQVDDPDALVARAAAAGATVVEAVSDSFTGYRSGTVRCPFGHRWNFARRDRVVSEAEIRAHLDAWLTGEQ